MESGLGHVIYFDPVVLLFNVPLQFLLPVVLLPVSCTELGVRVLLQCGETFSGSTRAGDTAP